MSVLQVKYYIRDWPVSWRLQLSSGKGGRSQRTYMHQNTSNYGSLIMLAVALLSSFINRLSNMSQTIDRKDFR